MSERVRDRVAGCDGGGQCRHQSPCRQCVQCGGRGQPSVGSVASIKLDSDTDGCVPATPALGHCPHRQQSSVDVKQIFMALTSEFL